MRCSVLKATGGRVLRTLAQLGIFSAPQQYEEINQSNAPQQNRTLLRRVLTGRSRVEDAQPVSWTQVPSKFCLGESLESQSGQHHVEIYSTCKWLQVALFLDIAGVRQCLPCKVT